MLLPDEAALIDGIRPPSLFAELGGRQSPGLASLAETMKQQCRRTTGGSINVSHER
jgi:hypothetical protein